MRSIVFTAEDAEEAVARWEQFAQEFHLRAEHAHSSEARQEALEQAVRFMRLAHQMTAMMAQGLATFAGMPTRPVLVRNLIEEANAERKQCAGCGECLVLSKFAPSKKSPDGRHNRCRQCVRLGIKG